MKFYSEILKKTFDTEKECLDAEIEYQAKQKKLEQEAQKRVAEEAKTKKELAKEIELADEELTEANKLYEVAQTKAAEILEKSNKEVKAILDTAKDKVKAAQEKKLNAVLNFNKKFGTYTVNYTGEKAAEEFNRTYNRINQLTRSFLNSLWLF